MLLFFCNNTFIIFIRGIGNILRSMTIEKCKFLLKSCYSVGYNYQIYHSIFRTAAMNSNNAFNYFSNIHDFLLCVSD